MCTILLRDETADARRLSAKKAQECVDLLMRYDRELSASDGKEVDPPDFPGYCSFHSSWNNTGHVYVWLDNCNYCESRHKGFYFVRYRLSMLAGCTTAYASPELVVEKKKLRPDQIEYMERKRQETFAAAKERAARKEE